MKYPRILTLLLFVLAGNLSAQKCETKVDPFTNQSVTSFTYSDPRNAPLSYLSIAYEKEVAELKLTFGYGGEINQKVSKGAEILLKMENGEMVKLITKTDVAPVTSLFMQGVIMSYFTYVTDADAATIKKLSLSPVTDVRYPDARGATTDLRSEHKWTKKYFASLMKGAACISQVMH